MKITRTINGKEMEIELTISEIFQAEREGRTEYEREDLLSRYKVNDESKIPKIIEQFEDSLANSDSYFECYWEAMRWVAQDNGLEENEEY